MNPLFKGSSMTLAKRFRCIAALPSLCALFAFASAASLAAQPAPAIVPRSGAGYVMSDGTVQIVACSSMGETVKALDDLFAATHPATSFSLRLGDNYSVMATLTFDRSAVGPLCTEYTRIGLGDNLKITAPPIGIRIAHASITPGTAVPALGVIVNPRNPLATLTVDQLTRIFTLGAPGGQIATWSQAGVTGNLADRGITPIGLPGNDYFDSDDPQAGEFLGTNKFGGLGFIHGYQSVSHYADVVDRVREDPSAIGITALNIPLTGVKFLPLKRQAVGTPVSATAAEIASGRYPLDRFVYLYMRVNKGTGLDPLALEYARLALSDEGQKIIAAGAAGYIPLNAGELAVEREKLAQ